MEDGKRKKIGVAPLQNTYTLDALHDHAGIRVPGSTDTRWWPAGQRARPPDWIASYVTQFPPRRLLVQTLHPSSLSLILLSKHVQRIALLRPTHRNTSQHNSASAVRVSHSSESARGAHHGALGVWAAKEEKSLRSDLCPVFPRSVYSTGRGNRHGTRNIYCCTHSYTHLQRER